MNGVVAMTAVQALGVRTDFRFERFIFIGPSERVQAAAVHSGFGNSAR